MTWESAGALGDLLAAIATVAMLVYLSIQIRQARETAQSATELEATKLFYHCVERVAADRNKQRIWDLVAENQSDIEDADLTDFIWNISATIHAAEGVWEQYKKGLISERIWMEWERLVTAMLKTQIGYSWWCQKASPFSPEFYEHIDKVLQDRDDWEMAPTRTSIQPARETGSKAHDQNLG